MLRMLDANRLNDFHFTVEDEIDGSWPVHGWGMPARAHEEPFPPHRAARSDRRAVLFSPSTRIDG